MVEILKKATKMNTGDEVEKVQSQRTPAKASKPIFAMNSREMDCFFGQLKTSMAAGDCVITVRKWAK
jgi:hypothetical protein